VFITLHHCIQDRAGKRAGKGKRKEEAPSARIWERDKETWDAGSNVGEGERRGKKGGRRPNSPSMTRERSMVSSRPSRGEKAVVIDKPMGGGKAEKGSIFLLEPPAWKERKRGGGRERERPDRFLP